MTLKIHSTEAERLAEYHICQERGHSELVGAPNFRSDYRDWKTCEHCGTQFRTETKLIESNKPEGAE